MAGYTLIENAPMVARNTLRVAARARLLAEVRNADSLPELLNLPAVQGSRLLVLGAGSNVLFTEDFDGTVLVLANRGIRVDSDGATTRITVAAGESWDGFVRWTLDQGYAGLENLILIPGTVGAAPIQNIGAYGCEVAEFVESVEAWDLREERRVWLDRTVCAFGYRDSLFKHEPGRYLVTAVRFLLTRDRPVRTEYAGINEALARMGIARPIPSDVAHVVERLRQAKLPDPALIGNAGSFFKNPIVPAAQVEALAHAHPGLTAWTQPDGHRKLSAAWLIEAAGFKGRRKGDAGISDRHALVLVNHGHATGAQLWALAQQVIQGVQARFGVTLEPEPVIIGRR